MSDKKPMVSRAGSCLAPARFEPEVRHFGCNLTPLALRFPAGQELVGLLQRSTQRFQIGDRTVEHQRTALNAVQSQEVEQFLTSVVQILKQSVRQVAVQILDAVPNRPGILETRKPTFKWLEINFQSGSTVERRIHNAFFGPKKFRHADPADHHVFTMNLPEVPLCDLPARVEVDGGITKKCLLGGVDQSIQGRISKYGSRFFGTELFQPFHQIGVQQESCLQLPVFTQKKVNDISMFLYRLLQVNQHGNLQTSGLHKGNGPQQARPVQYLSRTEPPGQSGRPSCIRLHGRES